MYLVLINRQIIKVSNDMTVIEIGKGISFNCRHLITSKKVPMPEWNKNLKKYAMQLCAR